MNQLSLIIKREYFNDIRSKSFWISTFLFPIITLSFGIVVGLLMEDSETLRSFGELNNGGAAEKDLTGLQIMGMMMGILLVIFLMVYGTQIFQKVKNEKTNRIMEILATCVDGRTMMIGKVISVGLIGLTQLAVWGILIIGGAAIMISFFSPELIGYLGKGSVWIGVLWGILYFIGGYMLFGSFYACIGAMTDKDNENQGYIVIITFLLMASFYISQYTIDNPNSALALWCSFIPLTSPGIGAVGSITGNLVWWQSIISLIILYASAFISISFAGKIYTSAMLLTGKTFSLKDIAIILKAK